MAEQVVPADNIEVAPEANVPDNDSAIFDDAESSTRSLTSSIYDYEKSHGRTFHAYHAGKYMFPNDQDELDRVDLTYHALRMAMWNKPFYSPIDSPSSILDVGTGTGIWAIDVADSYPAAEVIGIDLSPTQPEFVPPNCKFEVADAEEEWTFKADKFDLIHTRIMNDISFKDWNKYFRQALNALKPGGWIEAQECVYRRSTDDDTIPEGSRMKYWEDLWQEAMSHTGLKGHCNPDLVEQQMRDAGFVNITRRLFKLPLGPWARDPNLKEAGRFCFVAMNEGFHGLSVKLFTQILGWSVEEMEVLLAECRQELRRKSIHTYYPVYVIFAQKPGQPASEPEPTVDPTLEPTTEPTAEPTTESTTEPTTEPTTESKTEPATESKTADPKSTTTTTTT